MKSNLVVSYYIDPFHLLAPIAQLIEHQTCKLEVMSSIPGLAKILLLFFLFMRSPKSDIVQKNQIYKIFIWNCHFYMWEKHFQVKNYKNKEKKCLSESRFELGISDPIANHITTRPRSIYWNRGKNFEKSSISNMIHLYGLIQPMGGRNRVKPPRRSKVGKRSAF